MGGFNRDEQLEPGGALPIFAPGNRGLVVTRDVTGRCMPAEVRMYADRAVMSVVEVIVVVQVRVEEGRTQRRQLEGGGQRDRNGRSQHPAILNPYPEEFLNSCSEARGSSGGCATIR